MITDLAGYQQLVAFSYLLTFFGMSAAALFFLIERDRVAPDYRVSVALSGLVCAIAAGNYWFMRQIYVTGALAGGGAFPTEFRYIDWFLTVPLMLAQFPVHLGLGRRGGVFMAWLVGFSVLMLAAGYVGEMNAARPTVQLVLWAVGCVCGLAIAVPLGYSLRRLPSRVPPATATTVRVMTVLVLVGWTIYPLGFLQPVIGFPADTRELLYNIGDLVNKVGLGMAVFLGGMALARDPRAADQARPQPVATEMSAVDALTREVPLSVTDSLLASRR